MGLEPTTTRLRVLRSTDWARRAACYDSVARRALAPVRMLNGYVWESPFAALCAPRQQNQRMTAVGFEPTRIAPPELESGALDRSAKLSVDNLQKK